MTKNDLIDAILHYPLSFNQDMLNELISRKLSFQDIRECVRRIYDLSEGQLVETSNANTGMAGKLNSRSNKKREKIFYKRVLKQKPGTGYKFIYAEGDSWFQFPVFIKDILDWLKERKDYILYSEASGGDWITNIIFEGQYIPALSVYRPQFFLISGGGNDLVGNNRLAMMVQRNYNVPKYAGTGDIRDPSLNEEQKERIIRAQPHITKEFYAFIWMMKAQYLLLFSKLYSPHSTQKDVICITQGYDYVIPDKRIGFSLRYPLQPMVNYFLGNGQWLYRPLMLRGIFERELQKDLVMTFIYEFNQMFISIAQDFLFKNVYHIDCRGLAKPGDWYDELHYKSHIYHRVAKAYEYIIENHENNISKVIRVSDIPPA
jgi:hypothetical protein